MVDIKALTRDQLPSDPHMYWRLSEEERMLLTLMSSAYEDTVLVSLRERQGSVTLEASTYTLVDFLADCDSQVRHSVDFAKRREDFQQLDCDDRIACFRASIGPTMAVRNGFIYVAERDSWLMLRGELPLDLYVRLFPYNPYLMWGVELCRDLKALARTDVTIYALLHCILLFNPCNDKVSARQQVSAMRDKYVILLRHYLQATFSFAYAEDYVRVLQDHIVEIRELNRVSRKLFTEMKHIVSEDFVPFELLVEMHTG